MNYNNDDHNNIFKQIQANILYLPNAKQTHMTNDRHYNKNDFNTLGDRKYVSNHQQQERIESRYYQTGKQLQKTTDCNQPQQYPKQQQFHQNDLAQRPTTALIKKNRAIREHNTIEHTGSRTPTRTPAQIRKTPTHSPIRPKTPDYERRDNTRPQRTPDGRIKGRKMNINTKELEVKSNYESKSPSRKMNMYTNTNSNVNTNGNCNGYGKQMHTHTNSHQVNLTNGNHSNSHRNINQPNRNNQGYSNGNSNSNKGFIRPPNNPISSNRPQHQYQQHTIGEMRKVSSYSKLPIQNNPNSHTRYQQYQQSTKNNGDSHTNTGMNQLNTRNTNVPSSYYQSSSSHKKYNTTLHNNTIATINNTGSNPHAPVFESFGKPITQQYQHHTNNIQVPHKQNTINTDVPLKRKDFQPNTNTMNITKPKETYAPRPNTATVNNYIHNKSNNPSYTAKQGIPTSNYQLPEEDHRIDFNELDQFSPPYTGGGQLNLKNNDYRLTSTYSNIIEQRKEDNSSYNPSNNRRIINDFVSKIPTNGKKYSTIEYQKNDDFHRKTTSYAGAGIAPSNHNYYHY